jgi:hypothetical protein
MLQTLRILAVVLGFVIVFGTAYLLFNDTADAPADTETQEESADTLPLPNEAEPLTVSRSFSKGTHTVEGTISLPNPCYFLDVVATVSDSMPQVVTLTFTTADEGGICVQVIDERDFSVSFEAEEDIILKAVRDGVEISITEEV